MRNAVEVYPNYAAQIKAIDEGGITPGLLRDIIEKHLPLAAYNRRLHERYRGTQEAVPIFGRRARYQSQGKEPINNRINNDFFGEIVDFETGYFAGKAIGYSYSRSTESASQTGDEAALERAAKAVSDFVTRSNLYAKDMNATKNAAISGYTGRLFYVDEQGNERCMIVPSYEAILLSNTDMTEPKYGVRYFSTYDLENREHWTVEFYSGQETVFYEGESIQGLREVGREENLFGLCPLQGIPRNEELLGAAEKEAALIDAYDRAMSDSSNEVESFANAYMVYKNLRITDEELCKSQNSGVISFNSTGGSETDVYFLTKEVNDAFLEHYLERLERNIYRFSKTPNLSDENFAASASGISLKFKITGLEAKCGMFQAQMQSAGVYMFRLLAGAWEKKGIHIDPLQCVMNFKRNFPLDILSEAQAAQALIATGFPKREAWGSTLSFVDDVDYIMDMAQQEMDGVPSLEAGENRPEAE